MNATDAETLIFASYERVGRFLRGRDEHTRDLTGMRALLDIAGIDTNFAPALTVTGSKGKGSTSLFSAALLQGMGDTVGLVTSPHFRNVRERIRLNGRAIPEADFARIVTDLAPIIHEIDSALPVGRYLSPTGLFLAVALRYFSENSATALVLEVGRGGRYDDISLVQNQVAVITPIMAEHLDKLGATLSRVAWHKAGILKPGGTLVTTVQPPDVQATLTEITASLGGTLRLAADPPIHYRLNTPAVYQRQNLALAYSAVEALLGHIDPVKTAPFVERLRLPGRCERLSDAPIVYVDGAINGESAALFRASVADHLTRPLILVTALPHDKDAEGLFAELSPLVDQVIVTQVSAGHLHFDERPLLAARRHHAQVIDQPSVDQAFRDALDMAGAGGTIWIVGTQSLVRDALRYWERDPADVL